MQEVHRVVFLNEEEIDRRINDALGRSVYKYLKAVNENNKYLFEIIYDSIDYEYAYQYFDLDTEAIEGQCSVLRWNKYFGRTLDSKYNNDADFVIRVSRMADRYSSIGTAIKPGFTYDLLKDSSYSEVYKILPFYTVDGINEHGVFCSTASVPIADNRIPTTKTGVDGKPEVSMKMVCRWVLDHYKTATEAVNALKNDIRIVSSTEYTREGYEDHWMIGDKNSTYVVEIVNNEVIIREEDIMTNFYLSNIIKNEANSETGIIAGSVFSIKDNYDDNGTIISPVIQVNKLKPYSKGVERYNILNAEKNNIYSAESMLSLLESVHYTKAYDVENNNFWFSDHTGPNVIGMDITNGWLPENFSSLYPYLTAQYEQRSRTEGNTLHSVHTIVYNIDERDIKLVSQEDTEHVYSFNINETYTSREIDEKFDHVDALYNTAREDFTAALNTKQDKLPSILENEGKVLKVVKKDVGEETEHLDIEWADDIDVDVSSEWGNITGNISDNEALTAELNKKYEKPETGIAKSDLSQEVQSILDNAGPQDLSIYRTSADQDVIDSELKNQIDSTTKSYIIDSLNDITGVVDESGNYANVTALGHYRLDDIHIGDIVLVKSIATNYWVKSVDVVEEEVEEEGEMVTTSHFELALDRMAIADSELSDFYTKSEIDSTVATLQSSINGKVDIDPTKGLSTNDFTTELKTKLEGIEANANNYAISKADVEGVLTGNIQSHTHNQYLTEHQDISGKEDISNKVTTLSAATDNTKYLGAKVVKDALTEIEEVAEGKTVTLSTSCQLNMTVIRGKIESEMYSCRLLHPNGRTSFITEDVRDTTDYDLIINEDLNTQSDHLAIDSANAYLVKETSGLFTFLKLSEWLKTGTIILIQEVNVPDRWYDSGVLYPMEPCKIDTDNLVVSDTLTIGGTTITEAQLIKVLALLDTLETKDME